MSDKKTEKTPEVKVFPKTKAGKMKAVALAGKKLDKQFSQPGTFQKMGAKVGLPRPSIPSNAPSLDWRVLGCGGFLRGGIVELYGLESSGKTALACHIIGQAQQAGGVAAFVDAEHALDPTFATMLGVDMNELIVNQPDCGEDALETVIALVEAGAVDVIVVDSVAALVPRAELEGEMGDSHMGLHARMMSQAMRKLVGIVSKRSVTVIFINQIRSKVGVVFGDPNVTPGGHALKFAASARLEIRKLSKTDKGPIMEGDVQIGHWMNIKCQKNKGGAPFRETRLALYYDTGFDMDSDVIKHAIEIGVLTGAVKLSYASDKQGEKYSREDLDIARVRAEINKHYQELATQLKLDLEGLEESEDEETEASK
jgi:recombination protein RecA